MLTFLTFGGKSVFVTLSKAPFFNEVVRFLS